MGKSIPRRAKHLKKKQKEQDLLKDALQDLEKGLEKLGISKTRLEKKLTTVSSRLDTAQNKEIELRNQVSVLIKEEAGLTKKKMATKDKLAALNRKIEKMASVERELQEL